MKKIPWQGIATGGVILVVLVIGRCAVTAGRVLYYGGNDWISRVREDPWFYVGMVAAAVCVVAFLMLARREKQEEITDGCEE